MKGFFKISATVLAAGLAVTLAGCAGCASCSGSTNNSTVTNSNWYTGTSYKGIQPSFVADGEFADYKEVITYDVTFDGTSAANSAYSVEYKDGSYTTEFYATYFDWLDSEYFKSEEIELVYYYRTEFKISVKYSLKSGEESEWFDDSVVTECYFRAAGKNLQPIYSEQTIKSTSPNKSKPKSLAEAYKQIDVSYKNFYSPDCKDVITKITENGKEAESSTANFKKVKNSLFDNSSLYVVLRSMNVATSQTISLYSPAAGGVSSYTVSAKDTAIASEELKNISSALADKGLYYPKTTDAEGNPIEDPGIKTTAMSINYTGGSLVGTTQTVWYAAVESPDNNTARSTMLKISVPLSYQLGTLNYTLKEVVSTLWTGNN